MDQTPICEVGQRMLGKQRRKKGFCSQKAYSLVGESNNRKTTWAARQERGSRVCMHEGPRCSMGRGLLWEGCLVVRIVTASALVQCCAHRQCRASVSWLRGEALIARFSMWNNTISWHSRRVSPKADAAKCRVYEAHKAGPVERLEGWEGRGSGFSSQPCLQLAVWWPGTTPFPRLDLHFLIFKNEELEAVYLLELLQFREIFSEIWFMKD